MDRFFEPNGVSWRVVGHPVALIGGMRPLIIQNVLDAAKRVGRRR